MILINIDGYIINSYTYCGQIQNVYIDVKICCIVARYILFLFRKKRVIDHKL